MKVGEASATAQRVAAQRLTFDRVSAPWGNPAADERLARDVAGSSTRTPRGPMSAYLAARTAFFDRVVVGALERGVRQVVIAAAGYDGRALRYAKPGVRWFEVDHPDTQRDKRRRLEQLEIATPHITFVSAEFTSDDVGTAVVRAGYDTDVPSLFLCEGVAVYLDRSVLAALLQALRTIACAGSRLAISLSVSTDSAIQAARRREFQAAVAALGEPARTVLTAEEANALFSATGWRVVPSTSTPEAQDRARLAGFVVVEPL
jgi:methyltransferase (TIGR00027 family)